MKKDKTLDHAHIKTPRHSLEQERMFFGLAASLGYDVYKVKERAKERFQINCFNAITKTQINELIERLLQTKERREGANGHQSP